MSGDRDDTGNNDADGCVYELKMENVDLNTENTDLKTEITDLKTKVTILQEEIKELSEYENNAGNKVPICKIKTKYGHISHPNYQITLVVKNLPPSISNSTPRNMVFTWGYFLVLSPTPTSRLKDLSGISICLRLAIKFSVIILEVYPFLWWLGCEMLKWGISRHF